MSRSGPPRFKGLGKVKYYCQMCEKQCRDANGFKCHMATEGHRTQMKLFLENPTKYIEEFSEGFEDQFLAELGDSDQWLVANEVYSAIVRQPDHYHLNATKWSSFVDFLAYLETKGLVEKKVDPNRPPSMAVSYLVRRLDPERDAAIQKARQDEKRKLERAQERTEREFEKRIRVAESVVTDASLKNFSAPTKLELGNKKVAISFGFGKPKAVVSNLSGDDSPRASIKESSPQTLLVDCVVKVTKGEHKGEKGTVLIGSTDEALRVRFAKPTGETITVARASIETVIPNIQRRVKVVDAKHALAGQQGILLSIEEDKAVVFFPSLNESKKFDFDDISKLVD